MAESCAVTGTVPPLSELYKALVLAGGGGSGAVLLGDKCCQMIIVDFLNILTKTEGENDRLVFGF